MVTFRCSISALGVVRAPRCELPPAGEAEQTCLPSKAHKQFSARPTPPPVANLALVLPESFHRYDKVLLYAGAFDVYKNLSKWISAADDDIEQLKLVYRGLGAQRYREGIPLSEVLLALLITRRVLWSEVQSEGMQTLRSTQTTRW